MIATKLLLPFKQGYSPGVRRIAVPLALLFLRAQGAYPQSTLVFPQLAEGPEASSVLVLINAGSAEDTGQVQFFDSAGQPWELTVEGSQQSSISYMILPGGFTVVSVSGGESLSSGYALVSSETQESCLAGTLWSGDPDRDGHLEYTDFLDVENHPAITFKVDEIDILSKNEFGVTGDLTIRGVSRRVTLDVNYLGQWDTPFWVDGEDKGPKARAGFVATTTIDRDDFGGSWNGEMEDGGVVVGQDVLFTIDVEALLEN